MITPEKCTACRACELVCSFVHEYEFNPARSRIRVLTLDKTDCSVPMTCLQCDEASCLAVCPAGAITRNTKTKAMIVNEFKCIKCQMCLDICPFGGNSYDQRGRKILKCDLCSGEPACAKICPSGAIKYEEITASNIEKRVRAANKSAHMVREARGDVWLDREDSAR